MKDIVNIDLQHERERIGKRIVDLRIELGMTQEDLAVRTGLKQQNVARIELGRYSTGQDILSVISAVLGGRLDIVTEKK